MALDLLLAATQACAQPPSHSGNLLPSLPRPPLQLLLSLLPADTHPDVSTRAVAHLAESLLQPPHTEAQPAAAPAAEPAAVSVRLTPRVKSGTPGEQPSDPHVSVTLQPVAQQQRSSPAAAVDEYPAAAAAGPEPALAGQLPDSALAALLAALSRADAPATRAAVAAALRRLVSAETAAAAAAMWCESGRQLMSKAVSGKAAEPLAPGPGGAAGVSVSLQVQELPQPGSPTVGLLLWLKSKPAGAGGSQEQQLQLYASRKATTFSTSALQLTPEQLAKISLAAAEASSGFMSAMTLAHCLSQQECSSAADFYHIVHL